MRLWAIAAAAGWTCRSSSSWSAARYRSQWRDCDTRPSSQSRSIWVFCLFTPSKRICREIRWFRLGRFPRVRLIWAKNFVFEVQIRSLVIDSGGI
ncbi:hypothetical protein BRADI_3g26175v3 [Brachypodium distachyon]|uniref:Uncharacterized protein n=1 Tax=Brachypodium distachyon TaxID=15368 RepID=A0A2K2CZA4_BRADI|nr:hypothetical protein BRADI_3g26175v3 [Brachypodium distachyon]